MIERERDRLFQAWLEELSNAEPTHKERASTERVLQRQGEWASMQHWE